MNKKQSIDAIIPNQVGLGSKSVNVSKIICLILFMSTRQAAVTRVRIVALTVFSKLDGTSNPCSEPIGYVYSPSHP